MYSQLRNRPEAGFYDALHSAGRDATWILILSERRTTQTTHARGAAPGAAVLQSTLFLPVPSREAVASRR